MGETDWDTTLLANLMDENSVAREGYNLENLNNISTSQMRSFEAAKHANFRTIEATPHHALIDARAFRVAWHETLGTKIDSTN